MHGGYIDRGEVPGLVALVNRREDAHVEALGALSFGGAPMEHDTIFRIASMTKPITAPAAMILVEECNLRLDDPVGELLTELADRKVLRRLDAPLEEDHQLRLQAWPVVNATSGYIGAYPS